MTAKQFIESISFIFWFLTFALLSAFSFAVSPHVPNPDYPKWVLLCVIVNMLCCLRWFVASQKISGSVDG